MKGGRLELLDRIDELPSEPQFPSLSQTDEDVGVLNVLAEHVGVEFSQFAEEFLPSSPSGKGAGDRLRGSNLKT